MYNPFANRSVQELRAEDLATLATVPEGWFVEYKQEPCKPKDYAKEIAAFANGHGGWLIIGLSQNPSTGTPAGGPGVSSVDAVRLLDSARDGISQNVSPVPHFELGVVQGPIPELCIDEGKCLLVVNVPESQNTPHIHCSGKIYTRQGDKAAPVELTSRRDLDELYDRTARMREILDKTLDRGFDNRWAKEFDAPWIHCAITPSVTNRSRRTILPFETFQRIVANKTDEGMALDDAYASSVGYVARNHGVQKDPLGLAVTLEYAFDGSVYISVPMAAGSGSDTESGGFLETSNGKRFVELLAQSRMLGASVIDGTYLLACLLGTHARASQVLRAAGVDGAYLVRMRGMNLFRRVPFFNSETYLNWVTENSIPIIHRNDYCHPSRGDWSRIEDVHARFAIGGPASHVIVALGVPVTVAPKVIMDTLAPLIKVHTS